ncbi:unnamed protein product, partial [Prorocentrum cordatum]
DIELGLDHRAVKLSLQLPGRRKKRTSKHCAKNVDWRSVDAQKFEHAVTAALRSKLDSTAGDELVASTMCGASDGALNEASQACAAKGPAPKKRQELPLSIPEFINERRRAKAAQGEIDYRPLTGISKQLQKELRAWEMQKRKSRIASILEQRRGIGQIQDIDNGLRKQRLTSVKDKNGDVHTD